MYRDSWSQPAVRFLETLTPNQRERVNRAVSELCVDPRHASNVKALRGPLLGLYRKRIGAMRLIFSFDPQSRSLIIQAIRWRGGAYD